MADPKLMVLRRRDVCSRCGVEIAVGARAEWNPTERTVTCMACVASRTPADPQPASAPELERGSAGASAWRRYETLHTRREEHVKGKLGRRLGGAYLALSKESQSTRAWSVGGKGECLLGDYLDSLDDGSGLIVLHDRRIPGSRANIDHIAICRSGIYAIDAKNYTGKVKRVDKGGWFSTDMRLYVGRREYTRLVTGMKTQVEAIKKALAHAHLEQTSVEVKPALCFVDAEWSLFAKPFALDGVWVGWPKALGERLLEDGPVPRDRVDGLARHLAARLPSA